MAGACFGLAGVEVGTAISLNYLAPVLLLRGAQIVTIGYLIVRSTLAPRWLGLILLIGGSGYVAAAGFGLDAADRLGLKRDPETYN